MTIEDLLVEHQGFLSSIIMGLILASTGCVPNNNRSISVVDASNTSAIPTLVTSVQSENNQTISPRLHMIDDLPREFSMRVTWKRTLTESGNHGCNLNISFSTLLSMRQVHV